MLKFLKRKFSKPKPWFTLNQKKLDQLQQSPFISNALRLMQDADILFSYRRYATVVGLAILSAEELGKYLFHEWSSADSSFADGKKRSHKEKQLAIASLSVAKALRSEYKKQDIRFDQINSPHELKRLMEAAKIGLEKQARFVNSVMNKGVEIAKWSGFYYDEDSAAKGVEPLKITADNAREVMGIPAKAIILLQDEENIRLAKKMFEIFRKIKKD